MRKHLIETGENAGSIAGRDTIDKSRVDIAFVDNEGNAKQAGSENNG
jgi:hypothetical protein